MFQILFLCTTILKNTNFITEQILYWLHFSNKEVRKNPHTGSSIHFFFHRNISTSIQAKSRAILHEPTILIDQCDPHLKGGSSKDKKSLKEKMLYFVTSIPHVGNNHIIKENVLLLQVCHTETLMYGEETWTQTKRLNDSTMRPGKDKLINIRIR
jgi:hypothetical protein